MKTNRDNGRSMVRDKIVLPFIMSALCSASATADANLRGLCRAKASEKLAPELAAVKHTGSKLDGIAESGVAVVEIPKSAQTTVAANQKVAVEAANAGVKAKDDAKRLYISSDPGQKPSGREPKNAGLKTHSRTLLVETFGSKAGGILEIDQNPAVNKIAEDGTVRCREVNLVVKYFDQRTHWGADWSPTTLESTFSSHQLNTNNPRSVTPEPNH